jgi:translation initiation factor eIF-2B subunit delta
VISPLPSFLLQISLKMPVPTLTDPPSNPALNATAAKPQGQPSQKSMTKAERRELQEKQRAAKADLKVKQAQGGGGNQPKQPKSPGAPHKKTQAREPSKQSAPITKDSTITMDEAAGGKTVSRSLRIFTHFGLPKPVSHAKGDIHPAIIRLGLLFSEFIICGANARCIATLTAFKSVCFHFPDFFCNSVGSTPRLSKIIQLLQIRPFHVTS